LLLACLAKGHLNILIFSETTLQIKPRMRGMALFQKYIVYI
jgi:hypothetical protein